MITSKSKTAEAGIIVRFQTAATKASARVEGLVSAHAYIVVISFIVLFQFLSNAISGLPLKVPGAHVSAIGMLPKTLFPTTLAMITITLAASTFLLFVLVILVVFFVRRLRRVEQTVTNGKVSEGCER
jgi:hypothetical protein